MSLLKHFEVLLNDRMTSQNLYVSTLSPKIKRPTDSLLLPDAGINSTINSLYNYLEQVSYLFMLCQAKVKYDQFLRFIFLFCCCRVFRTCFRLNNSKPSTSCARSCTIYGTLPRIAWRSISATWLRWRKRCWSRRRGCTRAKRPWNRKYKPKSGAHRHTHESSLLHHQPSIAILYYYYLCIDSFLERMRHCMVRTLSRLPRRPRPHRVPRSPDKTHGRSRPLHQ